MKAPQFSAGDYLAAFLNLLPTGPAWPRDPSTISVGVMAALMPTYERNSDNASDLLVDAFPATTEELLPEWEATLGLPDPCASATPTIAESQAQVVARLAARGGQSVSYMIALAAALGYAITITQFKPFCFGDLFGLPLCGIPWAFAWEVIAPEYTIRAFLFGTSAFGEPFQEWDNTVLQCEMRRVSPAHTTLFFTYH